MPSVTIDIELCDIDDVSRSDVLEFIGAHGYKLNDSDIVDLVGDDDDAARAVALEYIRRQDTDSVGELLDAASYEHNVVDNMTTDDLIENLIRRSVDTLNDADLAYLTKAIRTKVENVAREYDSYLRDLLEMHRTRKRVENMAAAAQSALSH